MMRISDKLSGGALAALAMGVLVQASSFPDVPGQNVGPGLFPMAIAAVLLGCALVLVVRQARTASKQALLQKPEWLGLNRKTLAFVAVPVALVLYAAFSERLGFLPVSAGILGLLFLIFGVRPRTAALCAIVGPLLVHLLFYKLLRVPLPWGLLSPIAW